MSSSWSEVPFGEAIDFREGPGIMARDFQKDGVPLIRVAGLSQAVSVLIGCNYLDAQKVDAKWSHFRIRPGDTLLSTSASLGRVAVAGPEADGAIPYTGIIRMRPRDSAVLASFIPYLLRGPQFQQQVEAAGSGSVLRHFGPSHLKQMSVVLPPIKEQREIAQTLGSLDEKIENNRRLASILEEIVAALFKSRFVDFAGHHDLVESEIGPIPRGWELCPLDQVSAVLTRGRAPAYVDEGGTLVLNQKCVREGRVMFEVARRHDEHARSSEDRRVEIGDVLINSTGVGTLGRVSQVRWLPEPATVDGHMTLVRAATPDVIQDYLALTLMSCQADLERMAHGSTGQTELTRSRLAEMPILVPPRGEQDGLQLFFRPIQEKIGSLERENIALSGTRDALLPKIISGNIRVSFALPAESAK